MESDKVDFNHTTLYPALRKLGIGLQTLDVYEKYFFSNRKNTNRVLSAAYKEKTLRDIHRVMVEEAEKILLENISVYSDSDLADQFYEIYKTNAAFGMGTLVQWLHKNFPYKLPMAEVIWSLVIFRLHGTGY